MANGYFGATNKSNSYFGGGTSGGKLFNLPTISPIQVQELKAARAQAAIGGHSILGDLESTPGNLFHAGSSIVGTALNYLARPAEAVDTALTQGHLAGDAWDAKTFEAMGKGFWAGLSGKSHDTFADYIRASFPKFAAHHKTATAIAGFAGTLATDPTLPLIIGAQAVPGLNVGVDAAEAGRIASIMGTGVDSAARLNQAQKTIDAIDALTPEAASKSFTWRRAAAQLELKSAQDEIANKLPDLSLQTTRIGTQAGAVVEKAAQEEKLLQARYAVPFSGGKSIPLTPLTIGGLRVAPKALSLARTAEKGGVIGKIPGAAKAADTTGKLFKHGWGTEEFSKPALVASTKARQFVTDSLMHAAHAQLGQHFKSLSEKDMHKALNFGETRHGIVTASKTGRNLNARILGQAINHGELTKEQGAFLTDWHGFMEHMRQQEATFGVKHQGSVGDIVYVPHRYLRSGGRATVKELRDNFGLAKERQNLTLDSSIKAGYGKEKGLELVSNPAEILARRVMESADASTQHSLMNIMAHGAGIPSKIPDVARRREAITNVRRLMKKQRGLTHIVNQRGTRISLGRQIGKLQKDAAHAILSKRQGRLDELDAAIARHTEASKKAPSKTPTAAQARSMPPKAFRATIAHFDPQDKIAAARVHYLLADERRLSTKIGKLRSVRGGPQTAAKEIAGEVKRLEYDAVSMHETANPEDFKTEELAPNRQNRGESWKGNISTRLQAIRRNLSNDYEDIARKYRSDTNAATHLSEAKRLTAVRERHLTRTARELNAARTRVDVKANTLRDEWQSTFDKQAAKHTRWQSQIDKEQRAYTAMKKNPDIPAGWLEHKTKIDDTRYYFDPETHAAMNHIEAAVNNKGIMGSIHSGWMKMLGSWKIAVTSINPGYRVRNTASDIWNMYIAGVPMARQVQFGRRAAALQRLAYNGGKKLAANDAASLTNDELAALRAFSEMQLHGILSGLFQGDIQEVANMFHAGTRGRDYISGINPIKLGKAYVKATQDLNRHIENWGRITHYLYRRQYQHMSPNDAAEWVRKAHFDYEELTPFEKTYMKSVFPFYTWTRKNIPYQLMQMVGRPGKYASFGKIVQGSNDLATGSPHTPDEQESLMPSWMRENYMFRVPGFGSNAYINPNIGLQDLQAIDDPKNAIISHLNPVAQVGAALMTGKNPGTGTDIVGTHPRNPVSGIGAGLLSMIPGSNVGPTERTVDGKTVSGVGANPWYTYLAQQIPIVNSLINQGSNIKGKQRGGIGLGPLGYVSGVSVYKRDLQGEQTIAQLEFADKMKKVLRGLRDTGALSPAAAHTTSPFQTSLNQIIAGQGG